MTRDQLQGTAERYAELWSRRDPAGIAQCHAADGVAESPIYATLRGRKAIEDAPGAGALYEGALARNYPDETPSKTP